MSLPNRSDKKRYYEGSTSDQFKYYGSDLVKNSYTDEELNTGYLNCIVLNLDQIREVKELFEELEFTFFEREKIAEISACRCNVTFDSGESDLNHLEWDPIQDAILKEYDKKICEYEETLKRYGIKIEDKTFK
jgi:hypothetical protein